MDKLHLSSNYNIAKANDDFKFINSAKRAMDAIDSLLHHQLLKNAV